MWRIWLVAGILLGGTIQLSQSWECLDCVCEEDKISCRYQNLPGLLKRYVIQRRTNSWVSRFDARTCLGVTATTVNEIVQLALHVFPNLEYLDLRYTKLLCQSGIYKTVMVFTDCDHSKATTPVSTTKGVNSGQPLKTTTITTPQPSTVNPFTVSSNSNRQPLKTTTITTPQPTTVNPFTVTSNSNLDNTSVTENTSQVVTPDVNINNTTTMGNKTRLIMLCVGVPCTFILAILTISCGVKGCRACSRRLIQPSAGIENPAYRIEDLPHHRLVEEITSEELVEFQSATARVRKERKEQEQVKRHAAAMEREKLGIAASLTPPSTPDGTPPPLQGPDSYANEATSRNLPEIVPDEYVNDDKDKDNNDDHDENTTHLKRVYNTRTDPKPTQKWEESYMTLQRGKKAKKDGKKKTEKDE